MLASNAAAIHEIVRVSFNIALTYGHMYHEAMCIVMKVLATTAAPNV
jgi:hypothetical protein